MRPFFIALISAAFLGWALGYLFLATVAHGEPICPVTIPPGVFLWDEPNAPGTFGFLIYTRDGEVTRLVAEGFSSFPMQVNLGPGTYLLMASGSGWHRAAILRVVQDTPLWAQTTPPAPIS